MMMDRHRKRHGGKGEEGRGIRFGLAQRKESRRREEGRHDRRYLIRLSTGLVHTSSVLYSLPFSLSLTNLIDTNTHITN